VKGEDMRKVMLVCLLICCMSILVNCSPRRTYVPPPQSKEIWSIEPIFNPVDNKDFAVSIIPEYWSSYRQGYGWHAFKLSVTNKTNRNIEIVWDKTLFISNGSTNGRFMFEGVVYKERNNPRPNDLVFGNTTFKKLILPNNLVEFFPSRGLGWIHNIIQPGETGVYITIKVEEKEIGEKVLVNMRKE
jgi:hypothetical protein